MSDYVPSWMRDEEQNSSTIKTTPKVSESDEYVPSWLKEDSKESSIPASPKAEEIIAEAPKENPYEGRSYSLPGDDFSEEVNAYNAEENPETIPLTGAQESNKKFSENVRNVASYMGPAGEVISDIAGGLWNAPRNVAETALMVREALTGRSGDVDSFNKAVPTYRPQEGDTTGEILTTGTELLSGVGAGLKVGRAASEVAGLGGKTAKAVTGSGALVGEAAAVDEDSSTLVAGENSLFGLGINPGSIAASDNQGAKGLAKKIDIMADSMAAGAAVKFGAEVGGLLMNRTASISKSIFQYFNKTSRESNIADEAIFKMADIQPTDTQEEVLKKVQQLGDSIFDNNNLAKQVFDDNPDILASLPKETQDEIYSKLNIQRDVARSLEESGASAQSIDAARGIRKSAQAGDNSAAVGIRENLAEPLTRLERETQEISLRGRGQVDEAAASVRTEADLRSQQYLDDAQEMRDAFETRKDSVKELTKDSPELKSRVDDITKTVDLDVGRSTRASSEELASASREASTKADETYKSALNDIPDDIQVDKARISEILKANPELTPRLGDEFIRSVTDEAPMYKNVLESGSKSVKRAIDAIERTGNGTRKDIEDLMTIRSIIRDEPKAAYPEYAKQLKEADDAYKVWADTNKQGSVAEFRESGKVNKFQEVNRNVQDLKISKDVAKDAYKAEHLREALRTVDKEGLVDKHILDRAFENLRSKTNKTGDISLRDFVAEVKSLEKGSLSQAKQAELQDVLTSLRDRQAGLKGEEKLVRQAETKAKQSSARVFRNDFKEFFTDTADGYKPRGNSRKAFSEVFSGDNPYKVDDVISAVQKNGTKEAKDGLKAGYIESFNKNFINEGKEGVQRAGSFESLEDTLKHGEKVFADAPEVMVLLRSLAEESSKAARSQTGEALKIGKSTTEISRAVLKGVANLVTMRYGPLSRTGARINTVSSRIADLIHPEDTQKFLAELMTDTAKGGEFDKRLSKFIADIKKDKINVENPSYYKEFAKYLTKANLRTPEEINEFFDYRFKDSLMPVEK